MNTRFAAAAVLLSLSAAAFAAEPSAKSKKADKAEAAPAAEAGESDRSSLADGKKRIENFLALRSKKLQDAHSARLEFAAHETLLWEEFWGKERDVRKTFELRTARQVVDLFSTLETMDPKDHAGTITDFERLRGTMVKSFEDQQRRKMQDFFTAREARFRLFAEAQEKDRAAFASDGEAAWADDRAFLKSVFASGPAAAPAAGRKY